MRERDSNNSFVVRPNHLKNRVDGQKKLLRFYVCSKNEPKKQKFVESLPSVICTI